MLQTLEWMNGERLEALLQPASRALLRRGFDSPDALVAEVCLRLLGRGPTASAAEKMKRVLGSARTKPRSPISSGS